VGREHFLNEFAHPWLVRAGVTSEIPRSVVSSFDPTTDTLPASQARLNMFVAPSASVWPVARAAGRSGNRVMLGRDVDNDIAITNPAVSKVHACFIVGSDEVLLMDTGSKNGTEIDGRKLEPEQPVPLRDNHAVRFGGIVSSLYCTTELLWQLFASGALGIDPVSEGEKDE
jgi:hypothetical protein